MRLTHTHTGKDQMPVVVSVPISVNCIQTNAEFRDCHDVKSSKSEISFDYQLPISWFRYLYLEKGQLILDSMDYFPTGIVPNALSNSLFQQD